jgi:calcineurin-like phosphoesterase family protein
MKLKLEKKQKLWFTSDTHYGHTNICRGISKWRDENGNVPINQTRDFQTLEQMNNVIVDSINNVVGEDDILFHMGDFSFGGFERIIEFRKRIHCKSIHLILGNHDHHIERNKNNVQELFSSVNQYLRLEISVKPDTKLYIREYDFVLMHYPIASWHNMNDGVMHLHGHTHLSNEHKIGNGKSIDVGMDGNNMKPYSLNEIISIMNKQPIAKLSLPQDHHEERIEGNGGNKKGSSSF